MRTFLTRFFVGASVALCAVALCVPADAQSTPAPKPSAKPANVVKTSGYVRAFDFTRTNYNGPNLPAAKWPAINAAAFQIAGKLKGEYTLPGTPWTLGAAYYGAGLNDAGDILTTGYSKNIDNTLPGYQLSTLGEMYVQYKTKYALGVLGKQNYNLNWLPNSDSRVVPALYQGVSGNIAASKQVTLGGAYFARFKSRVTSAFNSNTLLTSANTPAGVPGDPVNKQQTNAGVLQLYAQAKFGSQLAANVYNYQFYDIANMTHFDATYQLAPKTAQKPTLAIQYITEANIGKAFAGSISANMLGAQFTTLLTKNLTMALSYDGSPSYSYTTTPAACGGVGVGKVFGGVPGPATGVPGVITCYGGGIASPYTDSYATDPLFTTQISQGLADVHKPGIGEKWALTWLSNSKKLRIIVSDARFDYSVPSLTDRRSEFNADGTVWFSPIPKSGPYRGLSFRERYAFRNAQWAFTPAPGQANISPGRFWYNRSQLEYTF